MRKKLKSCALVFCLFTFLLIVLGGGLRLNPGGAFLAAATGTPLLVYAFNSLVMRPSVFTSREEGEASCGRSEPASVSRRG